MKDDILAELWKIKDQIASEANYDTRKLFARLKKIQETSQHPVILATQADTAARPSDR